MSSSGLERSGNIRTWSVKNRDSIVVHRLACSRQQRVVLVSRLLANLPRIPPHARAVPTHKSVGSMATPARLSARSQDYLYPVTTPTSVSIDCAGLVIDTAKSVEPLSEIIGRLRKLKHSRQFLAGIFSSRDKQLYPRDLLVAYVPTKGKKGSGQRAVGILRRSLKYDKEKNRSSVYVDFVWVMPECRGQQVGKRLLLAGVVVGKQKDVRLMVAGSEANRAACRLYESVGFRWDEAAPPKTEMVLDGAAAAKAAAEAGGGVAAGSARGCGEIGGEGGGAVVTVAAQLDCDAAGAVTVRFEMRVGGRASWLRPKAAAVTATAAGLRLGGYVREERHSGCAAAA